MAVAREEEHILLSGRVTRHEQRAYVKIETLRGNLVPKIVSALKEVCGGDALDRSTIQRWHKRVHQGRTSLEDDPCSGRPLSATDRRNCVIVQTLIDEDARLTIEEIALQANLSETSVRRIIHKHLDLRKMSPRWVPHCLTDTQKHKKQSICKSCKNCCSATEMKGNAFSTE